MEDDRDTQAVYELKEKHDEANYVMQVLRAQTQNLERQQQRVELMNREIDALPDNSNLYKNIGKAYFLSTKPEILGELKTVSQIAADDLKTIAAKEEHTKKLLKATQDEMRELMGAISKPPSAVAASSSS